MTLRIGGTMVGKSKEYLIVIDKDTIERYNDYYFCKHPRRRVKPIQSPTHPSINAWFVLKRPAMNTLKGRWGEFIEWVIHDLNLNDIAIEQCEMEFTSYFNTARRADCDNMTPKFMLDGMVRAGFIVDDDYLHVTSIKIMCGLDRKNPRTEILVRVLGKGGVGDKEASI